MTYERIPPAATRTLPTGPEAAADTVALLRSGGLVVLPTDTVYGLAARAASDGAVRRIYAAKGRAFDKPLQLLVASLELVEAVAKLSPLDRARAARFLPGGLTLVLEALPACPLSVRAGGATVGVRVPAHPFALEVLRRLGEPVAATSANRSSEASPTTAGAAGQAMAGQVELIVDGGPCPAGRDSSVLDLTGTVPRLLREGAVARTQLEAVFGPLSVPA